MVNSIYFQNEIAISPAKYRFGRKCCRHLQ